MVSFHVYAYTIQKSELKHIRRWVGLTLCRRAEFFRRLATEVLHLRSYDSSWKTKIGILRRCTPQDPNFRVITLLSDLQRLPSLLDGPGRQKLHPEKEAQDVVSPHEVFVHFHNDGE